MYVRGCIHVWVQGTYMMHPCMSGHMCVCVCVCAYIAVCVPVCVTCVGMTLAHTWTWQSVPFSLYRTQLQQQHQDTSNEASNGSTRTSTEAITGYKIIYICGTDSEKQGK